MQGTDVPLLLPDRVFLTHDPDVSIARPCLGLVLYIDDPEAWASEHAARVCSRFIEVVGADRFRWFMTSTLDRWRPVTPEVLPALVEQLRVDQLSARVRHLLLFQLADDSGAPSVGFTYREVDSRRSDRLGYICLTLPHDHDPDDLLGLAIELGQTAPIWTGVGGFVMSTNPLYLSESFEWALRWTRRCPGLHVSRPDDFARAARTALPGVSWINLFGTRAIGDLGIDVDALGQRQWSSDIGIMRLSNAVLLRAGARPELGDANALEHPAAIAEVAAALGPFLATEPPPFPGPFGERSSAWMQRFSFPEDWT
jgi:hypothetical protein